MKFTYGVLSTLCCALGVISAGLGKPLMGLVITLMGVSFAILSLGEPK